MHAFFSSAADIVELILNRAIRRASVSIIFQIEYALKYHPIFPIIDRSVQNNIAKKVVELEFRFCASNFKWNF